MKIGKIEISKKLFITFIVVVVLTIIALIIKSAYVTEYEKYKIDKDMEFIYTYETYSESETDIPYVNIDNEFVKDLNEKLQEIGSKYADSDTSNNSMSYRYNVNKNIVSLVIIFKKLDSNNHLVFDYVTYVFDLDQNGKALTDDEILNKYNISIDQIDYEMSLQMVKKYDNEINNKILPEDCTYKDCYLKLRNIDKITDNAHYYIEDGWLVVYKYYNIYSEYKEADYFKRSDFKFYITNVKKNN